MIGDLVEITKADNLEIEASQIRVKLLSKFMSQMTQDFIKYISQLLRKKKKKKCA